MKKQLKTSFLVILGVLILFLTQKFAVTDTLKSLMICFGIFFIGFGAYIYIKNNDLIDIGIDAILHFIFGIF